MSEGARELIEYVRRRHCSWIDREYPPDHPRPKIPDWLPPAGTENAPLEPGEGVVCKPEVLSDERIWDEVPDVPENPFDVLAYYLPFHFYDYSWGIYIRATGVLSIARHLANAIRAPGGKPSACEIDVAFETLLEHEAFHHRVEMACARYGVPLCGNSPYHVYFDDRQAGLHEESMANANALMALTRRRRANATSASADRIVQGQVALLMERAPPGYRDFGPWVGDRSFETGKDLIINHVRRVWIKAHSVWEDELPPGLILGRRYFTDRSINHCPVYLVSDGVGKYLCRSGRTP